MSKKNKQILFQTYRLFQRKKRTLSEGSKNEYRTCLKNLENAVLASDREKATLYAAQAKQLSARYLHKNGFEQVVDLVLALAFALIVAIVIRQIWFEPYEIPTGSMRPTLKEKDRLLVSKTTFGINIPLTVGHFYFDPALVNYNDIFTFTGEKMDIPDADTRYFYIFPGKKQFVKRLLGKPGDLLYFYGGKIYGLDAQGNDISSKLQLSELELIDHIPFLRFDGQLSFPSPATGNLYPKAVIHQMGQSIALLDSTQGGKLLSLSEIHDKRFPAPKEFGKLWGMENFSMARLLSKGEAIAEGGDPKEEAKLYLELTHHPRLDRLDLVRDFQGRLRPGFRYEISLLPLGDEEMKTLFSHLYTARFRVKNGMATRYSAGGAELMPAQFVPRLPGVPDGMYEFYYGKAYEIGWEGISSELPETHPIYEQTPERLLLWFNLGLDFNNLYKPASRSSLTPTRYAYFNDGDFYVMGMPLWKKGNPKLAEFIAREQQVATQKQDYLPFVDCGPPTREDIEQYGLLIPERHYLALGDNHANSGDSRVFGFVPQGNLRGSPNAIFWPPGSRWGIPAQPSHPWFTLPNIGVWILFTIILSIWFYIHKRRTHLPLKDQF